MSNSNSHPRRTFPPLLLVGTDHRSAPLELREKVSYDGETAENLLLHLLADDEVAEAVVLSTCNRTEIYLHPASDPLVSEVSRLLQDRAGQLERPLEEYLYVRSGEDAARHLFRVASGLDALVVGEAEIQGQVRQAYELSVQGRGEDSPVGPVLHRLFQTALAVGGRVRTETRLGEGTASVAYVAVQLARKIFGSLQGRRVLILGAGGTSELVVDALSREGVSGVVVANRTYERAESLAQRLRGRAVQMAQMANALAGADVVVSSTSAPHPVLTRPVFGEAFPDGLRAPLLMIDLAIPRDVEPALADERNVFLYNVDDLRQIVDSNLAERRRAVPDAERIVDAVTGEFRGWLAAQEAVPLIRSLRERADRIRQEELATILDRMQELSDDQRAHLEAFSRRLLNKILHDPTVRLKRGAARADGDALIEAARFLYALEADLAEARSRDALTSKPEEDDDDS